MKPETLEMQLQVDVKIYNTKWAQLFLFFHTLRRIFSKKFKKVKVQFRGPNLPTNPLAASYKVNPSAIFKSAN